MHVVSYTALQARTAVCGAADASRALPRLRPALQQRYAVARAAGMYRELVSPCAITTRDIIHRIVDKRNEYEARNAKKVGAHARRQAVKQSRPLAGCRPPPGLGKAGGGGREHVLPFLLDATC